MKKLLIFGLLITAITGLTGCAVSDKIKGIFCKNSPSANLSLDTDKYISVPGVDIQNLGTLSDTEDDTLERAKALAVVNLNQIYHDYVGTFIPSEIISNLKETGKLDTLVAFFALDEVKDLHYIGIPSNVDNDNINEYIKENEGNLLMDIKLLDTQKKGTYILVPVHVGTTSASTAFYWKDSGDRIHAVRLNFPTDGEDKNKQEEITAEDFQKVKNDNSDAVVTVGNLADDKNVEENEDNDSNN